MTWRFSSNWVKSVCVGLMFPFSICVGQPAGGAAKPEFFPSVTKVEPIGFQTNTGVIFSLNRTSITNSSLTNSPRFRLLHKNRVTTNRVFEAFQPDTLGHLVWTNFIAHTNGREMRIWSERHFPKLPAESFHATWNTNGLMWGWRGLTGLSPHCEADQGSGQSPVTALTRRHGYTRGHGSGDEGLNPNGTGSKIWFLTLNNAVVEVKVKRRFVRLHSDDSKNRHADYSIILFDRDLPADIEPLRVSTLFQARSHMPFGKYREVPFINFMTEQGGGVSTGLPPFMLDVVKGGDSGCPNLLPLPSGLVFFGGRSTTGPTAEMQADMDKLSRLEKLDPRKYQMQWVDLSSYPSYSNILPEW